MASETKSYRYRYKGHAFTIRARGDRWQADFGEVNGTRRRKDCDTKVDAENWLRQQVLLRGDQGAAAFTLKDAQRLDAIRAIETITKTPRLYSVKDGEVSHLPRLSPLETMAAEYAEAWTILSGATASLKDAARYYVEHKAPATPRTVTEAIAEYIQDALDHHLRERSIRSIRFDLAKLEAKFGNHLVTEITREDADNWLRSFNDLAPVTRRHIRVISHGLYNYAIDRGYTTLENPFAQRKHRRKYHEDERLPECMNWRDVRTVMAAAMEHDPSMVPPLAIGFFAGLRTSELTALDWKQIDLAAKRITVSPEVAKKRRARYVTIEDNLLAWLLPHRKDSGPVAPEGQAWRYRLDDVREKAKVKWPKNAMRHSYASHYMVKTNDAAKTAFQLGHANSTGMLFEHYRAMVKPEDAEAYFDIRPDKIAGEIISIATAS